jgi:hypothetical protein
MAANRCTLLPVCLLLAFAIWELLPRHPLHASEVPAFLAEPGPFIEERAEGWALMKPRVQIFDGHTKKSEALIVFEDERLEIVEARRDLLPRLPLGRELVSFNPLTGRRTPIEDWTGDASAKEI